MNDDYKFGYKIRRISDGKFFRKNGKYKPYDVKIEEFNQEPFYHNNALYAHLYPTLDLAIKSIGSGYGWFNKDHQPIKREEDIFDLEIVPSIQYKDHVEFGEPMEAYWFFDEIKSHYLKYI